MATQMGTDMNTNPSQQAAVAPAEAPSQPAKPRGWRFTPHAIIFFSSACIMIIELVAGRLIARHLGSSLYTWTSIIGVVLAGMSLGNWIGGRLADRWAPRKFLGLLFLAASMLCLAALAMNQYFDSGLALAHIATLTKSHVEDVGWVTRIVLAVTTIFLPPALVLGMISPVAAKLALDRGRKVGATIGSVYAWGAIGSIVGTFATGYYLVAALGACGLVVSTALALAIMGLLLGPWRVAHAIWVAALAALLVLGKGMGQQVWPFTQVQRQVAAVDFIGKFLGLQETTWVKENLTLPKVRDKANETQAWDGKGFKRAAFARDGDYQYVKVVANGAWRTLVLDYLTHGYVNLDDPSDLSYTYEEVYRDVTLRYAGDKQTVSAFFIGGGAYAFQRWTLTEWPDARIDVAEIDPLVVEANHAATGLPRDTSIRTEIGDARVVVQALPADAKYDFFFGDAFSDLSVPFHLTTLEFTRRVADHLTDDGAYIINVIDDYRIGRFLGSFVLTLKQVFPHVYVFTSTRGSIAGDRDTFVLAASRKPLDAYGWEIGHDTDFAGALLGPKEMASLAVKCGGRLLTDDNAPVENLLQDVVRSRRD
jgi:spermidine synthase